jgi:vacuolar-type H+-ATPase subunit I/STV1
MKNKNLNDKSWNVSLFSKYLMDFNPNSKLAKNMNILKAISGLTKSKCKCSEKIENQTKTIQAIAFKLADELAAKNQEIAELKAQLATVRLVLDLNPFPAELVNEFTQEINAKQQETKSNNDND